MTPALIRHLLSLAEVRKARDLARLDALTAADRALQALITEASRTHAQDMASVETLPLVQLGARLAWADHRIAEARRRRASLVPEIALARRGATESLGKHHALEHLLAQAIRRTDREAAAKSERETPPRLTTRG